MKSRKIAFSIFGVFTLIIFFYFVYCFAFLIGDSYTLIRGSTIQAHLPPGITAGEDTLEAGRSSTGDTGAFQRAVPIKILGLIPAGEVSVNTIEAPIVYPSGRCIGVKLYSKGLIVSGFSDFEGEDGMCASPGAVAGLKAGDIILGLNGREVSAVADFVRLCDKSGGRCTLTIDRNGKKRKIRLNAQKCTDGHFRAGILVKNSVAGVGTLTYIGADGRSFGALGHPITDMGVIVPIKTATVYEADVIDIKKGQKGVPGEVVGAISENRQIGECRRNTEGGIYGTLNASELRGGATVALPSSQIREGRAQMLCVADVDDEAQLYDVEIVSVSRLNVNKTKSFSVRVTDKRLVDKTGGIVQGMSGSPIVQNGKLVGAVTHVFVNDPTRGYGIFIENMLAEEEKIK